MLSVAKVGRDRHKYYLQTAATGRPDAPGLVESDGVWLGALAVALGLDAKPVEERPLATLLEGTDPVNGDVLDPHHHRVRFAGIDCTFAAPKSVSLLHALGPPEVVAQVRAAHVVSVAAAVGYLESEAARVRDRRGGADRTVPTTGLAAAAFVHRTSRAPDPHLHSHVLVANLGRDQDGRWSALDSRPIYLHAATVSALYRAQLRDELVRRLDVAWRWRDDGLAELAGVTPAVLRAFSRRHEAIAEALARAGRSGPRAARIVAASGRPEKDLATSYEALVETWREQAIVAGVSVGRIAALAPGRPREADAPVPLLRRAAPEAIDRPFTRRDLVRARSQQLHDGARVIDVVAGVDAEIEAGLRTGALRPDPDRERRETGLRHRSGRRIPSGVVEPVLVSRDFLALEEELSARLARADAPRADRLEPGLYALRPSDHGPLEAAELLATLVARAVEDGRPLQMVAKGPRRAAHLEAISGVEAAGHLEARQPQAGALVVVADAEKWELSSLAALAEGAALGVSSVVLIPSPDSGSGRHAVAAALGRARRAEIPARPTAGAATRAPFAGFAGVHGPGAATVRLVGQVSELPAALDEEASRYRDPGACVVVGDRSLAASLGPMLGAHRVLGAHDARRALDRAPGAGAVVLGGPAVLGGPLASGPQSPRTYVALAPPGADGLERARWAVRLVHGRSAISRSPTRGRDDVANAPYRELGRERELARGLAR